MKGRETFRRLMLAEICEQHMNRDARKTFLPWLRPKWDRKRGGNQKHILIENTSASQSPTCTFEMCMSILQELPDTEL